MKKLVCGCFGKIYYATILKNGLMSSTDRKDVTHEAINAVTDHLTTLESFDNDAVSGYEIKTKDGRNLALMLYDTDRYSLIRKDTGEVIKEISKNQ